MCVLKGMHYTGKLPNLRLKPSIEIRDKIISAIVVPSFHNHIVHEPLITFLCNSNLLNF